MTFSTEPVQYRWEVTTGCGPEAAPAPPAALRLHKDSYGCGQGGCVEVVSSCDDKVWGVLCTQMCRVEPIEIGTSWSS